MATAGRPAVFRRFRRDRAGASPGKPEVRFQTLRSPKRKRIQ